jgi:uncharacterized protein YjbI with pentapeptide repeats
MVFPGETDFRHEAFEEANFEESKFEDANFSFAAFEKANFKDAAFGDADFREADSGDADFEGATFEEANFTRAAFEEGNFKNTTFEEAANFSGATLEDANFENATFGVAYFFEVAFERINFKDATFEGINVVNAVFEEVSFMRATFEGSYFEHVTFEEANFFDATFEHVTFEEVAFEEANFMGATFENKAVFDQSFEPWKNDQSVEATFSDCDFGGDVLFSGSSEEKRAFAGGKVNLEDVNIAPDASLHFRYADLSWCRFLRTDLRDAEFTGVKWCEEVSGDEWFRRAGLYDEVIEDEKYRSLGDILRTTFGRIGSPKGPHWTLFELRQNSGQGRWSEVERLYRQLKRNYEERGDFPRAGDFHIGEKEARRKNPRTNGPLKFLLYAYRALSKYGERALPAGAWLLFVIFACAGGYAYFGPEEYLTALRHSFQASFFPVSPIEIKGSGVEWVNLFQRVVSPLILFLLALALRQRVKR